MTPEELRISDNVSRTADADIARRTEAREGFMGAIADYIDEEIRAQVRGIVRWEIARAVELAMHKSAGPILRDVVADAVREHTTITVGLK